MEVQDKPQISIIIPCYNSEKYIGETLESILNQTYRDFEIICMDDGSTDCTGEVLDRYAAAHKCIRVYHDENRGQACQRNAGMEYACGKYVYFIDSDDQLKENALERLFTCAEENHLDVVYFEADSFYETEDLETSYPQFKELYHRKNSISDILTGEELYVKLQKEGNLIISPCLQFSSKEHLEEKKIRFPNMRSLEDNIFTVTSMLKAERAVCLSETLYLRRIRLDSVMTGDIKKERFAAYYDALILFLEILQEYREKEGVQRALCRQIGSFYRNFRRDYEKLSEERRKELFNIDEGREYYYMLLMQMFINIRDANMNDERNLWKEKKQKLTEQAKKKQENINQLREEKSELTAELKQARMERDTSKKELRSSQEKAQKLNEKLEKTYREKSELNIKLQQTYREKSERGEEIKRLRNSKDYRIGHKILWIPRKVKSLFLRGK